MINELDKCLDTLSALPAEKLHQTNCKLRSDLGVTEWRLAMSLLATERRGLAREFDCSSTIEYAEKHLNLAPQKANELLSTARTLEKLPGFSEAFRGGRLSWTKVRSLKRVITPETETMWLEYALNHTSREVERRVVQSPTRWKRSQALSASLEGKPRTTEEEVGQLLVSAPATAAKIEAPVSAATAVKTEAPVSAVPEARTEAPTLKARAEEPKQTVLPPPKYVRLTIDLTHDQYAVYQTMEERVWAKKGRKVSRAQVLMELCELELDRGSARARARHQVLIHTIESGQAWYETEKGALPASPEVVEEALKRREPLVASELQRTSARKYIPKTSPLRKPVPNGVARAVHARAGNRCERCGGRGPLQMHHRKPVSRGGDNSKENLELLCGACHDRAHQDDFEARPGWVRARAERMNARPRRHP